MSARTPPPGSGIVITTAAEARPRITSTTMSSTSVKPRDFRSRTATRGLEIAGIEIGILALAPRCAVGAERYDVELPAFAGHAILKGVITGSVGKAADIATRAVQIGVRKRGRGGCRGPEPLVRVGIGL